MPVVYSVLRTSRQRISLAELLQRRQNRNNFMGYLTLK